MSNKSQVPLFIILVGVVINFFVVLSGLESSSISAQNIAWTIGLALPSILLAAGVGLIVALLVRLFSKERTIYKFFLVLSITFFAVILFLACGNAVAQT